MQARRILGVASFLSDLRRAVEARFSDVWVEGEVSNLRRPASGHCYFTLKDAHAQIRCVLFRGTLRQQRFAPRDGMLLRVAGSASVYEARGDLQLKVSEIEAAGEGALRQAFEALKEKLAAEGLFDEGRKRALPRYPERIGIVTSGTGAAVRDVLSVLARRFPCAQALVCPVRVQGVGAAEEIAEAVAAFSHATGAIRPDVLIVGRGGGSAEDLWAFNEEVVARALADCTVPVISAVGHETDFSIADFVADVRAATPSMAAELAVPERSELAAVILGVEAALRSQAEQRIGEGQQRVRSIVRSRSFEAPARALDAALARCDALRARIDYAAQRRLATASSRVDSAVERLRLLDPRRPAALGYARIARGSSPIHRAASLSVGDSIRVRFADGEADAQITNVSVTDRRGGSDSRKFPTNVPLEPLPVSRKLR
jgi:exodeoxyribonuclease VII large subunit